MTIALDQYGYFKMFDVPSQREVPEAQVCLSGLLDVGLLRRTGENYLPALTLSNETLTLFAPLLASRRPRLKRISGDDEPVHLCTGLIEAPHSNADSKGMETAWLPAGGQGRDKVSAAVSCLGEMAERLSLYRLPQNRDPRIFPIRSDLEDLAAGPFFGFSPTQEHRAGNAHFAGFRLPDGKIDWNGLSEARVTVRHLATGRTAQLPAFGVLLNPLGEPGLPDFGSTLGAAVYTTFEEAVRRATWELVERDAMARAWHNRLWISGVDSGISAKYLGSYLADFLKARPRQTRFYRLETDLSAQVAVSLSCDSGGYMAALGVCAAPSFALALRSAVCEMLQSEKAQAWTTWAAQRDSARGNTPRVSRAVAYGRTTSIVEDLGLDHVPMACPASVEQVFSFETLMETCLDAGIDLWVLDATHPEIKVPCAKVVSPQLCSWEARFGKKRLYPGAVYEDPVRRSAFESAYEARPFPF
ncbi:hypothetical protein GCM10011316_15620 [Roseibium aquae]|uniref:YcaO domain-containing protein n=1 Tax=Roseibium aquae TaxID=1323746 RepID=A0A916TGT9_9HYPH|nr:YcaO-like family protein [Roseibium aquae]GGB44472.1 hypothetical protein GCM10011316_15620 [Roseibium aquae]